MTQDCFWLQLLYVHWDNPQWSSFGEVLSSAYFSCSSLYSRASQIFPKSRGQAENLGVSSTSKKRERVALSFSPHALSSSLDLSCSPPCPELLSLLQPPVRRAPLSCSPPGATCIPLVKPLTSVNDQCGGLLTCQGLKSVYDQCVGLPQYMMCVGGSWHVRGLPQYISSVRGLLQYIMYVRVGVVSAVYDVWGLLSGSPSIYRCLTITSGPPASKIYSPWWPGFV